MIRDSIANFSQSIILQGSKVYLSLNYHNKIKNYFICLNKEFIYTIKKLIMIFFFLLYN